jgi:RNA polymerase sigma-70 factor (ECF subfamily)
MHGAAAISLSTPDAPAAEDFDDLLARVAAGGDREAFSRLFRHFGPRLKGYLMRIGTSAEHAEDLAQDVMLKVWRKARLFDPVKASAATWIFTIARNCRIDALRRQAAGGVDAADPTFLPDEEPQADAAIERRQRDARIRLAFAKLPPNQQDVVRLHFLEDEPHTAIAGRLDLPLGTVKSRLRLAFERIRRELGETL